MNLTRDNDRTFFGIPLASAGRFPGLRFQKLREMERMEVRSISAGVHSYSHTDGHTAGYWRDSKSESTVMQVLSF